MMAKKSLFWSNNPNGDMTFGKKDKAMLGTNPFTFLRDSLKAAYLSGYTLGNERRYRLLKDGYQPERMDNNTYPGDTWIGLYGYMDAMEGKPTRFLIPVQCPYCGHSQI